MKIIDLSHSIKPDMPVFPGTESPIFETPVSIDHDGFTEKKITLFTHTGTHVDAPAHILKETITLDKMNIDHFWGKGCVIDVSNLDGSNISRDFLLANQKQIEVVSFVLFYSGWSDYWGTKKYFDDFPLLDAEAAEWLTSFDLKGVGVDMISLDIVDSTEMAVHKILLQKGFILIENLTNLYSIRDMEFYFSCLPLKITDADGSPIRAVAVCM